MSLRHARRMAAYNAPLYVVIAVTVLVGGGLAVGADALVLRLAGGVAAAVAGWFGLASFAAFAWLFDRSPLLEGRWLADVAAPPRRWLQLSVFLEQTTLPLGAVFPGAEGLQLDVFSPNAMTEPAVQRARGAGVDGAPRPSRPDALDAPDGWADLTVVTLVAHELRDVAIRRRLFAELARVTAASGRVVLVEHTRNLAALLAYGPGWWHFMPASEWRERAADAGLEVVATRHLTPFVVVLTLAHPA